MYVLGIDGCRSGWIVARKEFSSNTVDEIKLITKLGELSSDLESGKVGAVGIDIPIGVPDSGSRECDVALRKYLGPRRSSVFPEPIRITLASDVSADYGIARKVSLATHGKSLSIQAFNLLPKIAEADEFIRGARFQNVFEVHPEASFTAMNHDQPLVHPKKIIEGQLERRELLERQFESLPEMLSFKTGAAQKDDIFDAIAALWSAQRWLNNEAVSFGADQKDSAELPMQIWV